MAKIKYPAITALALLTSILVGCSDKGVEKETATGSDTNSQAVDQQEGELIVDELKEEEAEKASTKLPSVPLEDYKDINEDDDPSFFHAIAFAQTPDIATDEFKLGSNKEYNSEVDAFKKEELAKTLLPKINADISHYEKNGYRFKMPIVDHDGQLPKAEKGSPRPVYLPSSNFALDAYSFEQKGFPISACDKSMNAVPFLLSIDDSAFNNTRGYDLKLFVVSEPNEVKNSQCILQVENEDQARKIEEVRSNYKVAVKGYGYFDIPVRKGEYKVTAQPVQIDLTYYNQDTNEVLATKSFTW